MRHRDMALEKDREESSFGLGKGRTGKRPLISTYRQTPSDQMSAGCPPCGWSDRTCGSAVQAAASRH